NDREGEAFFGLHMFMQRRDRGGLEEIAEPFRAMARQFPEVPLVRCFHACLEAELGEHEAARGVLDELVEHDCGALPRDLTLLAALVLLADTCAELGER